MEGRAEKVAVSLYPVDRRIVERVRREMMLNSFSAALQLILRRWADEHGVEVRGEQVEMAL